MSVDTVQDSIKPGPSAYRAFARAENAWSRLGCGSTYAMEYIAAHWKRHGGSEWRPAVIMKALRDAEIEYEKDELRSAFGGEA